MGIKYVINARCFIPSLVWCPYFKFGSLWPEGACRGCEETVLPPFLLLLGAVTFFKTHIDEAAF